jgi:hypothetical protein
MTVNYGVVEDDNSEIQALISDGIRHELYDGVKARHPISSRRFSSPSHPGDG